MSSRFSCGGSTANRQDQFLPVLLAFARPFGKNIERKDFKIFNFYEKQLDDLRQISRKVDQVPGTEGPAASKSSGLHPIICLERLRLPVNGKAIIAGTIIWTLKHAGSQEARVVG